MGEVSADPAAMEQYFQDGCQQIAKWIPEIEQLREVLDDLWGALTDGNVPAEYHAGVTARTGHDLAYEFEQTREDVRHVDRYIYDVAVAIAEADGFDPDDVSDLQATGTGESFWPDEVLTVPDSALDDIGPADRSEVAPSLSLVEELEQDPGRWHELDRVVRDQLIEHRPDRIGSIDGLPTEARHEANMLVLQEEKAGFLTEHERLQGEVDALLVDLGVEGISSVDELREQTSNLHHHLTEDEYTELALRLIRLEEVDGQLLAIGAIESRINAPWVASHSGAHPDAIPPPAYLLGFGTEGIGQVILAVGDPDHADNVATYVPGMKTTIEGVGDNIGVIDTMWSAATETAPTDTTSVILWFDYDAPQGLDEAMFPGAASDAARPLQDFQAGLELSSIDSTVNRTVIGYSYGSTAVGHAAISAPLATDSILFVGSSGVGAADVDDLGIDPDRVYATESAPEIVWLVPWFVLGPSPADPLFGARTFPSDPGGHKSYFEPGNVFFDNVAAVITGQHDRLQPEPAPEEPTPRPDEVSDPAPSGGTDEPPAEPSDEPGPSPSPPGD